MSVPMRETTERVLRTWYGLGWASESITREGVLEVMLAAGMMDSVPESSGVCSSDANEPTQRQKAKEANLGFPGGVDLEAEFQFKNERIKDLEGANQVVPEAEITQNKEASLRGLISESYTYTTISHKNRRIRDLEKANQLLDANMDTARQTIRSLAKHGDSMQEELSALRNLIQMLKDVHGSILSNVPYLQKLAGFLERSKWAK